MSKKKFKYVIVVDGKTGKPMAWDEISKQLCFCQGNDNPHPVRFYTVYRASRLIKKSIEYREKKNFSQTEYSTLPFEIKYWHELMSKRK